jgi:hypothetical protein
MKRWLVKLQAGEVRLAAVQDPTVVEPEYVDNVSFGVAFVLAVDELGAFAKAKQLLAEQAK